MLESAEEFDMTVLIYEARSSANAQLATNLILNLEKLGVPLHEFVDGISVYCSGIGVHQQAVRHLEEASRLLRNHQSLTTNEEDSHAK